MAESAIIPCCKPLRMIELFCLILGGYLTSLLRRYHPHDSLMSDGTMILAITVYGAYTLVLFSDVIAQLFRHPISNVPMIEVLLLGFVFFVANGVVMFTINLSNPNSDAYMTLNILCLEGFISFGIAVVFLIDALILINYSWSLITTPTVLLL